MLKLFTYLWFILIPITALSQDLIVDWDECFGDTEYWSYSDCIEFSPNNSTLVSVRVSTNNVAYTNYHGSGDAWVLILDISGNIIQERCFGGSGAEYFGDIEVTDEYVYFIGQTSSTDGDVQSETIGENRNLWVVKTDWELNIIWERQYGCLGTQAFEVAKVTEEGGLILLMDFFGQGGGDVSEYYGNTDIWVCEIDANGDILWEKTLGNATENLASDVIQLKNGNIVVLGETYGPGGMIECAGYGNRDIWIAELDSQNHDIIWQNCYGGSLGDGSATIIEDESGFFIVGGTQSSDGNIESYNHGGGDAWAFDIDFGGQLLWERCFGGTDGESLTNIFKTVEGNYLLFGRTGSTDGDVNNTNCPYPFCPTSAWVIELDNDKNILWNGTHGSYDYSYFKRNGIRRVGERDFIIAGVVGEEGIQLGDVDCEPYPIHSGYSAWIYRLYDPNVGLQEYTHSLSLKTYPNPAFRPVQITFELPAISKESSSRSRIFLGRHLVARTAFAQRTNPIAMELQPCG